MPLQDVPSKLTLRVLEEFDPEFKTNIARCLETGTVATAESIDEAHDLLMETLRLEVVQVSRARRPLALFEKPAGPIYELRWQALAAEHAPTPETITVYDSPLGERKGVKSELSILAVKQTTVWPSDIGEVHKDIALGILESDNGIQPRMDREYSRHVFLRSKGAELEWPFPLNRDGIHFSPIIILRILERFDIDGKVFIESLRMHLAKKESA